MNKWHMPTTWKKLQQTLFVLVGVSGALGFILVTLSFSVSVVMVLSSSSSSTCFSAGGRRSSSSTA